MSPTREEDHKDRIRESFDALENHDPAAFTQLLAPDFTFNSAALDREEYTAEEFKWYDAFPDLTQTLERLIAEDDLVTFQWTFRGTHTGEGGPSIFQRIDPTHREVDVRGINIARFESGKIAEMWAQWDTLVLLHQLDLITVPGE